MMTDENFNNSIGINIFGTIVTLFWTITMLTFADKTFVLRFNFHEHLQHVTKFTVILQ